MVSTPLKQRLAVVLSALPLVVAGADEAWPQAVGQATTIACTAVAVPAAAATSVVVVSGTSGQQISICGWIFSGGTGTGTVSYSYSTAANACTASTTVVANTMSVPANSTILFENSTALISLPQGASLCSLPSGTNVLQTVFYTKN